MQKYLRHCTVFWLKWPVYDLVLVTPPPPLIKVASNSRPCSKLGGTTLNGREEGGQYLSHRPVTSSDLKQERLCFRESVSTFLQLVVAFDLTAIFQIFNFFSLRDLRDIGCSNIHVSSLNKVTLHFLFHYI